MFEPDEEPIKKDEQQGIKTQEKSPDLTPSSLIENKKVSQKIVDVPPTTSKQPEEDANETAEKNLRDALRNLSPIDTPVILARTLYFAIKEFDESEFFSKIFNEARSHISIEAEDTEDNKVYEVHLVFWKDDEKLKKAPINFDMAVEIFTEQAMEAKSK